MGVDVQQPRLSWQSDAKTNDWMQVAYRVRVASSAAKLKSGDAWDSGRVESSSSVDVRYAGAALLSRKRYLWTVEVWDNKGGHSVSTPAWFEMGLLSPSDWTAKWIRRNDAAADREIADVRWLWQPKVDNRHLTSKNVTEFRYTLNLDHVPERASLHVLVRGSFVARVNGVQTGTHDQWSAFDYEEIRPLLKVGANEILVTVTPQSVNSSGIATAAFAASLRLTQHQGEETRIVSDENWQVRAKDGVWTSAKVLGPITEPYGLGTDRGSPIPGPDRVTTDVSLLKKSFHAKGAVKQARLRITALGSYRAYLNGKPVAPGTLLDPGFTDFHKRVLYQTYDVTAMLHPGANNVGAMLAGGWHGSPMTWIGSREYKGPDFLLAQLDITYADGSQQTVATDGTWTTAASPILNSEIYAGEAYDARVAGWSAPKWEAAVVGTPVDTPSVTAQPDLSIATPETLHPVSMKSFADHTVVYDMGQNMVGNVVLHVAGPRGTVVRLRYAERLNPDGSIYIENLRNATVTDFYTLAGGAAETFTPSFTFHGFRYVEVQNLPGTATTATIDGTVYNSLPAQPSVRFSSNNDLLNGMGRLGIWGQRGNFLSIPTDCPQRDERLGWMGDAGVFWRTGTYNFDISSFTHKFMLDILDAQTASGSFTDIAPNLLGVKEGAPGWNDAGVLVPYAAWLQYGDTALLERSWPEMERYMRFIEETNPNHLRQKKLGSNYGDWLAPDQHTPRDLIATAYWAIVARDMKEMALALGKRDDADKYQRLYDAVAEAYRKEYVKSDGEVKGNTQASYVVTLFAGINPPEMKAAMMARLVKDIEAHGNHLTTGFLGTPFLMFVLDENGRSDVAFKLLMQDTYPSWGYMVRKGATTWWERWNGDTGDPAMNSYNHYAFGSVMAWVFRRVAGIDTDDAGAGYHHIVIKPHFDDTLPQLHTEYDSAYGTIVTDWKKSTSTFTVTTPANTTATVTLPDGTKTEIGSGTHSYPIR